jgi:copper chaperone
MEVFKFKTNIKCDGCLTTVTPMLNNVDCIEHWAVDTTHKDKILTVKGRDIDGDEVETAVRLAGFSIERMSQCLYSSFF